MAYGDDNRVEPGSQEFGVEKVNTLNGVETNSGIDSDFNGMEKEEKVQSAGLGAGLKGLSAQSAEDEAQATAQVEYSTGVTRVQDELESEDFPSAKSLYEKTLGVTEYDELRAKLHLRDDESFTEYYERTHYIPKGFEVQAKLLLAEEKRKKLYNEVSEGRMSEEDFLYEAYGKDLLKRDGVDFSSSLYWYNRYKGGDYTDPRKNDTYMLQLIENARTMFERETWYEAIANHDVTNLAKYVTGETLDAEQVKSLFADQFEMLSEYFDNEAEVIKYYRAGLLQGFQPTIDTDGDGKVDYYYAPDGKLYNVNETGQGANTARAYYNSDGSLNRIVVSGKDSLLAEGVVQTLKGFAGFFTGVVDFVGLVTGATADLVEGLAGKGWDLSATTEAQANLSQFWNSGFLGDQDYVVTQGLDDVATWVRGGGRLLGTIGAFFATMGMSSWGNAGGAASKAATTATKKGLLGTVKQGFSNLKAMGVKKAITSAPKGIAKSLANTAVRLTSFANGTTASGTIGAMAKNAATTALKDSLQAAVTLSVNAPMLYEQGIVDHELTGGDILGLSFATFGLEFATGMLLRSACNTTAVDRFKTYKHWGTISKQTSKTLLTYAPQSIKFAKAGLGTNVLRISNLAMDAIDNIVCQTAQTSLATKGQLFNFDVLGQTLSNPSVLMNIAWQTKSNIRDNWGISNEDIVFANTNAAENLLSLKDWVHKQALNAKTPQDADNWRAIGKDIDTRHAQELANIRANAPQGTKVEAAAAMKVFEDTSQKLGLFKDTELPKFTKKLTAEEVDKLDPVQRYAYKMWEIRSTMEFEYTNAIIDTINNYYSTYNNITKKVLRWGYRSVFGDGVKDAIVKSSQAFLSKVINDDRALEWEAALGAAFRKSEEVEDLVKKMDGKGTEFLEILDKAEVDMVKVKRDEDGKIIFEGGLADKLKDDSKASAEYQKWVEDQSGQGKLLQATQSVYILTSNTGTALDGDATRSNSIKALDTIYKLFNVLLPNGEGGNLKIEKFGDGAAYLIKFNGLGDHVLTLQQVSGMLQSIAALRLSLGEDTDLSNTKSVTILKTFLQLLSDAPSDELLTTDADVTVTAQVINELLANKLITHLEAARLIQGLNSHIAELNKDTDGPKSMLKLDKALSATGVLNTNKDTSVDMSNYDTAQRLADTLPKVEEALRTIQDLQTKNKTEATRKSDQDKLLRAKEALKDDTVNEILVKGGLINKDFRSKLNPFTPGLKVNNHVRPTQANESNVVNRETLHQELVKRFNVSNEEGELKYTRDDGVTLAVGKKAKNKAVISLGDIDDNHQGFHKYLQAQNNRAEDLEFLKKNTNPKKRSTILTQLTKLKDKASAEDKATIDRILADYTEYATKTVVEIFKAKDYQDVDFKETLDTIADAFNKAYPNNAPIDAKYLKDLFSNPSEEGIELIKGLITEGIVSPRQFTSKILSTRDTFQDNFAELHQKYSNLTNNSKMKAEELHTSDKVVIRLNECMGDAFEGALRRLNNPIIAENVASKTSESEIYAELFPSGKIKEFKRQYVVWKQLRELYGDEVVLPQAEAAEILKLLGYNFNGDFLYVNSERQVPGVYFITNQQGYNLGSSDSLAKLEYLANKRATTSDASEVILTTDAISKAQTLSGNITYITEKSQIDINEVVLKPKFVPGTEAASSYIKELTNNKSGKLASQTPTADREFKTFVGSNEYNETHRTAIYVNQIVNKLSELYKDSYNKKSPVVEGPLVTFNNKEAADTYVNDIKNSGLWDANILPVDNAHDNVQVQVTLKVGLTQEEFCNKAFGLIKDNDGKLTYDIIKVLIPNNINEPQETTIVAKGVGASSKSSAQLISGYIYNFMRASHDMDETQFFKLLQLSNEVKVGDISNQAYKAAIAETKGENGEPLTAGQILAKKYSDNIFFNIIKGSISTTLAISKALRARVTELACENSKSPSATSAWISTLLGSDDMRRDIGSALNTVLSKNTKKHFDDKGNLIITPELLTEIRNTVKLVTTSDSHDFEEIKLAIASDEALGGYLQLLSITMIKKPRGKLTQDTLAQKLYAAIRSATHTGSDDIHISIKDLFRLSDEDLTAGPNGEPAPVNQILRDIGAKEIPQEILDTIVSSGVRYKYQEKPTTNYKLAQTEKVSNTFDSAFGTIVKQDTTDEGSPKFQIGNNEPSDSLTIDDMTVKNMFARGASINNGELAFKLSVAMDERYDNPIHQKLIADSQQRSGLLNFVNYPSTGSLTRANFNYSLVKYRHFNNIITIAEDLHQLEGFNHLDSEQLVNLVCNLYDLSTGTQMASVRPEYALVDASTGSIIDVSTFIKHEDDYSSYDGIIAALAAHNLLDSDKAHDIQIIKLKQNGFNTLYGDAVDPIEIYSLAENVSAFNAMIAHRRAQLDSRNNYSSTDKTASDEALKNYYANILVDSPSHHNNLVRECAASADIPEDAIQSLLTSIQSISVLSNTNTAAEESFKTLLGENRDDSRAYYQLQQLRDLQSFGETKESLEKIPGLKDTLAQANDEFFGRIDQKYLDEHQKTFDDIIGYFDEGNTDLVTKAINFMLKDAPLEDRVEIVKNLLMYAIYKDNSIESTLFKLSGQTLGKFIQKKQALNNVQAFKWDDTKKEVASTNEFINIEEAVKKPRLVIDIERLYSKGVESRTYQIAYRYVKDNNTVDEGVIFLKNPNEHTTAQALLEEYPDFAKEYGENNSIKWFIEGLPEEYKGHEKDLAALRNIIAQANNDGAYLLGSNSNVFDIPALLGDPKLAGYVEGLQTLTCLDTLELSKRLPTTYNIIQTDHKLRLGETATQLGIKVDKTKQHDALYDIELTDQVFRELAKHAIEQENHGSKFALKMQAILKYTQNTSKGLIQAHVNSLQNLANELDNVQTAIKSKTTELDTIGKQIESTKKSQQSLGTDIDSIKTLKAELKATITELKSKRDSLYTNDLHQAKQDLKETNQALQDKFNRIIKSIDKARKDLGLALTKDDYTFNKGLQDLTDAEKKLASALHKPGSSYNKTLLEKQRLQDTIDKLETEIANIKQALTKNYQKLDSLKEEQSGKFSSMDALKQEKSDLYTEQSNLRQDLQSLEQAQIKGEAAEYNIQFYDPFLSDKILKDIRYTDANTIDATIKGRIDTAIAHRQDPDRLYKFTLVLNALNNRLVANNVNVRRKELKALLDRNQLHTVHTLHAALASPVKRSRLFSAVKLYLVGGLAQDKDIPTNPDELTYALNKFNSWICKTYKVDSLNNDTLTQILKDPEDLISKILFEVKVSAEDFNKLEATYGDSLTQSLVREFSDVTSKSIAEDSALYYLDRALKPLKDYLRDVFLPSIEVDSTIRNEAEERILDSMQRMLDTPYTFDNNGQKVRKPLRPNNIEVLLSKTQQEVIDYIQQSPIERTTYKNIYDMCGTTLDKIKTSAHAEDFTRLKNDTIYITPARFAELIGKPRSEASSKEIARWQSYFGNKDGEIYIPVQRHPRDNRDSLHFMRVEFLPDDHKGFEIMMNIDTMKSKFNGDFDGDAVSLIAPTKFLNNYATLVNPYKNYAYSIVDDFMEGLITSASPVDNTSTLIHNLRNNTVISNKLTEDLETLHNFREGNILAHYEALKAQFTEHVKGEIEKVLPDNLDEKSKADLLKNIIEDIYIVKPIPIYSTNTTDGTSMVFYTDFPALNKNSLNKSYKELYRNNSIASVDTLSRLDSASGEFQKDNILYELANRLKNNKLKLNDSAMILSETSRRLVAKNVNHARAVILNRIETDYKGNKDLLKFFKTILPEGEGCTVQNIEAALRVIQTVKQIEMYQTKDLQTAVNMLHTEFKDDPDVKAMQRWLDVNNNKSGNIHDDLSKFYYSIDDIIKLQNFKGNRVASRADTNIGELLDNSNKFTLTGFITLDDDGATNGTQAKSMQSKLNVLVRIKAPENTPVQEIGEDTFLLGPNHQAASIHVPATVKLSDAKFDKVKHKYFSDGTAGKLLTPKEAEQIGITIKGPYDVMLCTYDEPTQQILYHRVFNLAKAKIGVYGDKAFKATASSAVDTSQFPAAMQDHIQDVHIMYGPNVLDTKSGTSAYKSHDAIYFDAEGNIVEPDATGTIPNTAVYMKTQEDISSLSSYPVWNKTLKETDINQLDIANSLEDTAGVWQTKGMFYKVRKTRGKNEYTLEYDDQGFQSFKKRLQEENSPNLRQHNASETYELLRFMLLCKYAKEDHPDDYAEYVQTNLSKAFDNNNNNSYLRDVNEMLTIKYKKKILQDSNDKLVSTLLLDNELANRVYKKKGGIAEQNTNLTTKGSNARHIISQSKKFTEEAPGGEFRQGLDIFPHVPNMSNCELINYINAKLGTGNQIYESSMQRLTEGNRLPVGEFRDTRLDGHDYISNDDNKIQNALGAPTRAFSGASILPADELGRDALQEYRLIKDAHGYKTTPLNATKPKSNNYSKKMIIMLKALIGDKDHNLNKYDLYDQLTANSKSYIYSVDIPQYSTDSGKGLVYKPQQYIDKETQLAGGISTRSVLEKLNSIRANTDYHTDLQKTSDSLQPELLATKSVPTITDVNTRVSPDHHNLTSIRRDPFKDHATIIKEYKLLAGDLDEVQELNSKAPTVGSKVIQNHKVFENEKIMWNHGIKIKDADDLIQDRNIKQVSADMVNYRDNYSVDIVRLNNYAVNHDSVKSVNEIVYLIALQDQIKAVDNAISHTKDDAKRAQYQIQKDSLIASLEELGLKDLKEADTRLAQLQKDHQTEFYMVNKILTTLSEDTQKYNNLNGEPCGNISYLITNTAHADKKKRKASVKGILKSIGSKEPYATDQKSSKYTLPVYNTFNFFDSISATVTQVAKRKAIYENSLRLRKDGVIDNSSTQRILNETFEKHIETIRTLDNQPEDNMRRSLISTWMYITEQLDSYISLDDSLVRNIEDAFSDGKTPIGSIYADIYLLLNNVMRQTGITYETASLDNVNKADARRFLLCNEIIQDIFACMSHLTKDQLLKDLTDNLINFADTKGLKLVDRFGKPIDPKHIYTTDEGSLAFIQRALDNRTESTYRQGLARDAIQGELYFMDAGLADAYSKTVFVKYKKPNWLMRTVQKTSNWCIKMLMASPFKLVDRFLKFSAFDMATLGSANAKTLAYQGKSFTDLKAYFMSKGSHKSTDLEEFLNSQGIRMNSDSFDLVLNTDPDTSVGLFKGYQDATGNWFTFQSLSQRYAYWLATKESLKKGDYSVLGSAYHLKDAISELKAITDSDGKVMVTKEGQQAAFAMAQMIGASNDFPGVSKTFNRYGMVFTTFPLAAARWGMGEFRSLNAAIKDMFTNGITSSGGLWLLRQGSGIVGTFIAEQLLVSLICDMFGVTDEEQEKEWKDVGALPNVTQTLIQGQPIMDTFSSMNILREFYGLTLEPFLSKDETKTDESTLLKGFERYLNKNIVSHINPIIKNIGEVATKKDLIDDQIISTDQKYNGFENVFRKLSSYVIGGAGANALTKELQNRSDGFPASFFRGMQKAINAELGNTKTIKENTKNYYKMLNLVNEYRDYSNQNNTQWSNGDFNIAQYNQVKSKLYSLISSRASANEVYKALNEFRNQGYTAQELRSALKTCSLSERINKLSDSTEFLEALTESEKQNLQTALAYEEYMFPWIDDNVEVLNQYIKNKQQNSYNSTVSAPYYRTNYYSYKSNKLPTYANQSYNYFNHNAYTSPYKTYADSIKNLQNSYISSYNPYKNNTPTDAYNSLQHTIQYNAQQGGKY